MPPKVYELHGTRVFECEGEGSPMGNSQDAVTLIGEARSQDATVVAIPVSRLAPDFFRLRTGMAGDMLQKFVMYGVRVVLVGNISEQVAASTALRDFVTESNRGDAIWFVTTVADLENRLSTPRP
jgi:Domain of unknown function (DUF4180)